MTGQNIGHADASAKHRRSLRLKGYDYAQAGGYFITVCTQDRVCLFGEVVDGAMCLNGVGQLAALLWSNIPARFPGIDLDVFVIMPNHVHAVIVLSDNAPVVGAPLVGAQDRAATRAAPTIANIVGAFKSLFTLRYVQGVKKGRWPAFNRRVWQRNYYEHVIRDETELAQVRRYIDENPLRWELDQENPQRIAS